MLIVAVCATVLVVAPAGRGFAKASPTTTPQVKGDRIVADTLDISPKVRFNRALNAVSPVKVRATIRLSDLEDPIGFSGAIDPSSGTAALKARFQGISTTMRVLDDSGYLALLGDDKAKFLADWISFDLTSSDVPFLGQFGALVIARPALLSSVGTWKTITTAEDRSAGLLRYRGTGDVQALALDKVAGFKPGVRVDLWVNKSMFVTRIDWRIFPDTSEQAQGVTATARYEPGDPISPVKPVGRITDFAKLIAASATTDTTVPTA
jgi:hypothetical protein